MGKLIHKNKNDTKPVFSQSGFTLYSVLILISIVTIYFSTILTDLYYLQKQTINQNHESQAKLLAKSGITRAEYFLNGADGHDMNWETDKYEEQIDDYGKIQIKAEKFGLFSRIVSKGIKLNTEYTLSGLYGRGVPGILNPSLTLTGHVGGLILKGGSDIENLIVLHHGEIYREKRGKPLTDYRKRLINRISPSFPFDSTVIPDLMNNLDKDFKYMLSNKYKKTVNPDSNENEKLPIIIIKSDFTIDSIVNNSELFISGKLVLKDGASVNDSKIYCSEIVIYNGITQRSLFYCENRLQIAGGIHNSQFFCRDSVIIKNKAKFKRMNVIAGYRQIEGDTAVKGGICFENGCSITGTVISCQETVSKNIVTGPSIVIGKKSVVNGVLVTDRDIEFMDVEIMGHVWARSVVCNDEGKSYTNYIIRSKIKGGDEEEIFPMLGGKPVFVRTGCWRKLGKN
jgi:hypothetical protein